MDRKQMCVSNVKYKKPTQNEAKRMKNLLGYLTYRESATEKARHAGGRERWINRGMGGSVAEIADRCDAYQSEHVLLFSLVINPNTDLIRMVPPEKRERFVRQLTEHTMNGFFDRRGIDTGVEWSGVLCFIIGKRMVMRLLDNITHICTSFCRAPITMRMRDNASRCISAGIKLSTTSICYMRSLRSRWRTCWVATPDPTGSNVTTRWM